jgi:acyl-lipid omega-6 desaturase (Delta-12 desaturase)
MHRPSISRSDLGGQVRSSPAGELSPIAFGKSQYIALKRSLSFEPSGVVSVLVWLTTLALAALALWLANDHGLVAYVGSQVLLVAAFFQSFALLHECGHGSAFRRGWANVLFGHLASLLCFLPFYPWRFIHQAHHVWTGNVDHDPTMRSVRVWRDRGQVPGIVRFGWRSWIPIMAVFQHVVFWTYPLRLARSQGARRGQILRCGWSVAFLAVAYGALWSWQGDALSFRVVGPALIAYLVVVELVNLPHHVGMPTFEGRLPLWDQWKTTRSCYYPLGISEFFTLNFNFHTEHHLFPSLPWFRLRRARRLIRGALGNDYREQIGISWNVERRSRPLSEVVFDQRRRSSV